MSVFARRAELLALLLMLVGCGSHAPDRIAISESQSVVMDATVRDAGVSVDRPTVSRSGLYPAASAAVSYGQARRPLTLHYRFLWYDARGLDILPYEPARTLTLQPGQVATLLTRSADERARQVRLHLYL